MDTLFSSSALWEKIHDIKTKTNTKKQLPPWAVTAITPDSQRLTHGIVITWKHENCTAPSWQTSLFIFLFRFYSLIAILFMNKCDTCPWNTEGAKLLFTLYLVRWQYIYMLFHLPFNHQCAVLLAVIKQRRKKKMPDRHFSSLDTDHEDNVFIENGKTKTHWQFAEIGACM